MISIKKIAAIALVSIAAIGSSYVFAASKTATFEVSLTIQDDCSISANPLNFGSTGVLASNIDQTTNLSVTCTVGTPYNVALDAGSASGSTIPVRTMLGGDGSSTVQYNLYSDTARTQVWGQTVSTDTVAGTGNGNAQSYTVYGRVPPQPTPAPGTYLSTVTATVIF